MFNDNGNEHIHVGIFHGFICNSSLVQYHFFYLKKMYFLFNYYLNYIYIIIVVRFVSAFVLKICSPSLLNLVSFNSVFQIAEFIFNIY